MLLDNLNYSEWYLSDLWITIGHFTRSQDTINNLLNTQDGSTGFIRSGQNLQKERSRILSKVDNNSPEHTSHATLNTDLLTILFQAGEEIILRDPGLRISGEFVHVRGDWAEGLGRVFVSDHASEDWSWHWSRSIIILRPGHGGSESGFTLPGNDLTLGCQTSDSASSSNFHHLPLLALLVALVLY